MGKCLITWDSQTKFTRLVKDWITATIVNGSRAMLGTVRSSAKDFDQYVWVDNNAL